MGMVPGSVAFLAVHGTSSASYVDVDDNDATAENPIVLGPGSIKGPNTPGWQLADVVPSVGLLGQAALAVAVLWVARRSLAKLRRMGA